jgi:hypothetical protein
VSSIRAHLCHSPFSLSPSKKAHRRLNQTSIPHHSQHKRAISRVWRKVWGQQLHQGSNCVCVHSPVVHQLVTSPPVLSPSSSMSAPCINGLFFSHSPCSAHLAQLTGSLSLHWPDANAIFSSSCAALESAAPAQAPQAPHFSCGWLSESKKRAVAQTDTSLGLH